MRVSFTRVDIFKDILAGITAAIVALPLALAFGVASGLGAISGLYGAIGLGLVAALFGGTRTQISGPTGPMTVVCATVIASFSNNLGIIVSVFVLAGLFQILFGAFRLGRYIQYVPYPVISGFMSGIGVIIILLQISPFIGFTSPTKAWDIIMQLPNMISKTNIHAILLGSITILIVYLFPKITKQIPSTLIALLLGTIISILFNLKVPLIGEIPVGLPNIQFPSLSLDILPTILIPALTLAALGSIDSLLTSVVSDKLTKEKHQSNRELMGQGIGNIVASLLGGIPGAGATMRTVVNIQAGGKSRLSGVVHALVLFIILLALGPYASLIPMPVLAGILITVGIGIIDYKGIKDFKLVPRSDVIVTIIVLGLTIFVDLLQAVAVGIVLSSLFLIRHTNSSINKFWRENLLIFPLNENGTLLVKRFRGPLFFGISNVFQEKITSYINQVDPKVIAIILDLSEVSYIDQSGFYALTDTITNTESTIVTLIFVLPRDETFNPIREKINSNNKTNIQFTYTSEEAEKLLQTKYQGPHISS
ncbi:SulP family inorganic anion transporter (plasmid) [Bacillus mycoides]|uniref:SulP family inorganic anion transporter n=1 Tax=Bacillus mycoides TaxID=1405 RepID=UPI001C021B11|nr:SulP family inorganic anion transporter [Bacillus mycoides]QWH64219.1 SulP family inorganic anion transporter [Bacillus mycoides]